MQLATNDYDSNYEKPKISICWQSTKSIITLDNTSSQISQLVIHRPQQSFLWFTYVDVWKIIL